MYVWIGLNVSEFLPKFTSERKRLYDSLGFNNNLCSLPLHISLKMSFDINEEIKDEVIDLITEYAKNLNPMIITPKKIENNNGICWIIMEENKILNRIHNDLNSMLLNKYNVPLHEYDCDFLFHTTLFMHEDIELVNKAYLKIKDLDLPKELIPEEILVGVSADGSIGSYEIVRRIFI